MEAINKSSETFLPRNSINSISTSIGCIQLLFRSSWSWHIMEWKLIEWLGPKLQDSVVPFHLGQLTIHPTWVCRKKKRKSNSQTMKTGLQITMLIHFGEVFRSVWDVLGKVFRWSITSRLQFHGTPRNPGTQLPWEPGPFPSLVAAVINRSTVHRRGPKKKTLK